MKDKKVVCVDLRSRGHLKLTLYFHGIIHARFPERELQVKIFSTSF